MMKTYCGFIAIVGRPNVGKSTLLNHLLQQKISITSRKSQTTQHKINGILTINDTQYIFVDTPGFQQQKRYLNQFNRSLNQLVVDSLNEVDAIIFVVEAGVFTAADNLVLELLTKVNLPVIVVVNKQDKVKDKLALNEYIKQLKQKWHSQGDNNAAVLQSKAQAIILLSAKHATNLAALLDALKPHLPLSEFLYDRDQLTDRDSRFLVTEIIREKLFRYLGEELPYNTKVVLDTYHEDNKRISKIAATIFVEKDSKKAIVIGDGGARLKKIGSEARVDIERLIGSKVFLQLWVKVKYAKHSN